MGQKVKKVYPCKKIYLDNNVVTIWVRVCLRTNLLIRTLTLAS